jgi:glycerol-3-phosphate dehydrogenase
VSEALRERGLLYRNAFHLVQNLAFVVPRYRWWEDPFYGIGLELYDALAGDFDPAPSHGLDMAQNDNKPSHLGTVIVLHAVVERQLGYQLIRFQAQTLETT